MKITENELRNEIQNLVKEYISEQERNSRYQEFFMNAMDKASDVLGREIDSPRDFDENERAAFFNYVDTVWDEEEGQARDMDVDMADMLGEAKIRAKVREQIRKLVR